MMDSTKVNGARTDRKRGIKRVLLGLAVAVTATLALSAWAQHGAGGYGGGHGGHGGGMGMFGGGPEHTGRMLDHMLDGLNATDAQRGQIKQIAQAAAADMKTQHEAGRALREKGMQIFSAPTVDAAAAEQLRQQMLAQHDQMSRRSLQAMLDASRVLTPEQRAKLAERMKQRGDMMRERMHRADGERAKS